MAATMAVTTMVTKSKESWSLQLPGLALPWNSREGKNDIEFPRRALFASVSLNMSPALCNPLEHDTTAQPTDNCDATCQLTAAAKEKQVGEADEETLEVAMKEQQQKKKIGKKQQQLGMLRKVVRVKITNPHVRRLVSGAMAGAVSRTFVAPLETIRTHLMVGSSDVDSMAGVFRWIMRTEGWSGLFRGNAINILRVAPSKAIEHFTYDTAKKFLTPKPDELPKVPIPTPLVAGALAGVASTLCTYPMELIKTRVTIERGAYENVAHAFMKILREEGPSELYRGLAPSLIGVVPYAACNFYAYETLKQLYRRASGRRGDVGSMATLVIGSVAGAIASSATFPLEVARKQMQVGAVGGRQVYQNVLHAMYCIIKKEGVSGLYRGLGPSCIKLMPAAGISFMCYEACKRILIEGEDYDEEADDTDDKEKKTA